MIDIIVSIIILYNIDDVLSDNSKQTLNIYDQWCGISHIDQ